MDTTVDVMVESEVTVVEGPVIVVDEVVVILCVDVTTIVDVEVSVGTGLPLDFSIPLSVVHRRFVAEDTADLAISRSAYTPDKCIS